MVVAVDFVVPVTNALAIADVAAVAVVGSLDNAAAAAFECRPLLVGAVAVVGRRF